jgi:hypothetical protein
MHLIFQLGLDSACLSIAARLQAASDFIWKHVSVRLPWGNQELQPNSTLNCLIRSGGHLVEEGRSAARDEEDLAIWPSTPHPRPDHVDAGDMQLDAGSTG